MRIAVAGSSGVVGRYVVQAAKEAGHSTIAMSRRDGVNIQTGEGVREALTGVDVIVDVTNSIILNAKKATAFFTEVTQRLQTVGAEQGASRLVTLSIVGVEFVPRYGYYVAKLAQEHAAQQGPLPAVIVRSTQFHEFAVQVMSKTHWGPITLAPQMRIQPVAARSVGQILIEVATGTANATSFQVGGPKEEELVEMVRTFTRLHRIRTAVIPLRVPGAAGKVMRSGGLLPLPGARIVGPTYQEWLNGEDSTSVLRK